MAKWKVRVTASGCCSSSFVEESSGWQLSGALALHYCRLHHVG